MRLLMRLSVEVVAIADRITTISADKRGVRGYCR